MLSFLSSCALGFAILPGVFASPFMKIEKRSQEAIELALNTNFPDPSFIKEDDTWYAFGTNGNNKRVQVATSKDFKSWNLLDKELLPTVAGWETKKDHWAPDVIKRDDGRYVMYYSGEAKQKLRHHCVGVAVSKGTDPTGPYVPNDEPLSCRLDQGGSIDPAGFQDKDGSRYVVFKVDGNSIGNGGDCNNGIAPLKPTPILLQKVKEDGFTLDGDAVQILDRNDTDGPLVEAPSLVLKGDTYYLFYSTHCFTSDKYDVRVATSKSLKGPYTKNNKSIVASGDKAGDVALRSPGGGTVCERGDQILFHGWCGNGQKTRCTYAASISLNNGQVSIP